MSGLRQRILSLPTAAAVALTVLAAALVGVAGGGTMALWRDVETVTARMPAGVVVFGVGAPTTPGALSDYATGPGDTVELTFGATAAQTLYSTGAVAVPFQVDALAQGHRGLTYTLTRQISGGVFGDSAVKLVKVPNVAACTTGAAGTDTTTSAPVSSAYSSATTLTTEYWCLVATFERAKGSYANTATVDAGVTTSGGSTGVRVGDSDSWSADVRKYFVPAQEPTHRVVLSFTTSRSVP